MKWIPYQKLTITTDLSKDELVSRMKERLGPHEIFVKVRTNIFSGRLVGNKFQLTLNKSYRNSWTPEINGEIVEQNGITEVLVTLQSNLFVIIFTTLFIIFGLTIFVNEIINFKDIQDFDLTSLLFLIFPYGLCWFGFNLDADKSIDGLIKITKGEIK